jgi:hypothetical protein
MSRSLLILFPAAILACSLPFGIAKPPAPDNLPIGRWSVAFANGVKEACEIRKDGTASVMEPLRTSIGKAEVKEGSVVFVFEDDRIERWKPVSGKMVVEHWASSAQFPSGTPVLGIGEADAVKGLQMSLRLERERYRVDEPVALEVVIKNNREEEADLGMSAADLSNFEFVVRYVGGGMTQAGKMPMTKFGTKLLNEVPDSKNVPIRLKPGGQRSYRFTLNRMVDLTLSGTYSVAVKRAVSSHPLPDAAGKLDVLVSNELAVEIMEPTIRSR